MFRRNSLVDQISRDTSRMELLSGAMNGDNIGKVIEVIGLKQL